MMRFARTLCHVGCAVVFGLVLGAPAAHGLDVGDPSPDFQLQRSDGGQAALADFVGKKGFVLAWFPKAFTPG